MTQGLCFGGIVTVPLGVTRSNDEIMADERDASRLSISGRMLD